MYLAMTKTLNRRNFSKKIALGTVGMGVVAPLSLGCKAPLKKEGSLGVALVGLGSYSTYQLAPALEKTNHCHLAAVVTGTPSKAKKWASKYRLSQEHIYNYSNFDRIADDPAIDIVYIVLPNAMHAEFSIRAARAGKHVICEKPMGLTSQECVDIMNACKEAKVKLGMGYRLHSEPYTKEVKRLVRDQVFGSPQYISSTAGYISRGNPNQWRLNKSLSGGGALMNMGVYAFQALIYATGSNPKSVSAQEFSSRPDYFKDTDETITAQFEWENGTLGQMMTSHNYRSNHLRGEYDRGWIELSPASTYIPLAGKTSDGPMEFKQESQQKLQMDDFALHIMGEQANRAPGEMGHRDLLIIEAIYTSIAAGGRRIELPIASDYGISPLF
jgi:glucose-fructose oxidoreductase